MSNYLGLSQRGLELALSLRHRYADGEPLIIPDEPDKMLMPEHLLNNHIDLEGFEDPLPLAVVAARDPVSPMSICARWWWAGGRL